MNGVSLRTPTNPTLKLPRDGNLKNGIENSCVDAEKLDGGLVLNVNVYQNSMTFVTVSYYRDRSKYRKSLGKGSQIRKVG